MSNLEKILEKAVETTDELIGMIIDEDRPCFVFKNGFGLCGGTETVDCKICIRRYLESLTNEGEL